MAACWSELAARSGYAVTIIASDPPTGGTACFSRELLGSLDVRFLGSRDICHYPTVRSIVASKSPSVVVLSGWWNPGYRRLARALAPEGVAVVMTMDNPRRSSLRASLRRLRSWRYFRHVDAVVVPGERARLLAEALGFRPSQTYGGLYGVDFAGLLPSFQQRKATPWPRRFLYVGQLSRRKRFDTLIEGYEKYRAVVRDPWPLTVCGAGPLGALAEAASGVQYRGFVDPREHSDLYAEHGISVLPSKFDPWPLAIVEACAAGLPILCSVECGSAVELVRDHYNGRVVSLGRPSEVAAGLRWFHDHAGALSMMGKRSTELAAAYSAEVWALRWSSMLETTLRGRCGFDDAIL